MNCSVSEPKKSRTWLFPALLSVFLSTYLLASQASAETGNHHQEYLDALSTVINAETRIDAEMARISNGSVAHYDFLQHQHIELLRHAKALHHPPTGMSSSDRDGVLAQADALLIAAESIELVIADYLRAEAQLSSALSNTLDLLATHPSADTNYLQGLADAVGEFRKDNTSQTRDVLYAAFDRVASLDSGQEWQDALSIQASMIRSNSTEAASAPSKLAMTGIASLAEELRASYIAAMPQ